MAEDFGGASDNSDQNIAVRHQPQQSGGGPSTLGVVASDIGNAGRIFNVRIESHDRDSLLRQFIDARADAPVILRRDGNAIYLLAQQFINGA